MTKKINSKLIKLVKYYSLINYNLIYDSNAINRYKKDGFKLTGNKTDQLQKLKNSLKNINTTIRIEFKKSS